jgi:Transposase DDE domain group 1
MRVTGLGRGLSTGLDRWRAPRAVHDPGKIVADLAAAVALGGDCLADIAVLREQPELAGPVASDPVVSRLVSALAADLPRALKAIRSARAAARERAWALAGENAPGADGGLVTVDLDATIVIAHSEKEQAAPTWKKTFGFHPVAAFADHGAAGNGEPLAIMLRTGGAGSNTAADHIETTRLALAQLPRRQRRRVLVRTDSACLPAVPAGLSHSLGRSPLHRGGGRPGVLPGGRSWVRTSDPSLVRSENLLANRLLDLHSQRGPGRLGLGECAQVTAVDRA